MAADLTALTAKIGLYNDLGKQINQSKKFRDQLATEIREAFGDDGIGEVGGVPVMTYHGTKKTALSQEVLRRDYPEVYDNCLVTTEVRTLKVVPPQKKGTTE